LATLPSLGCAEQAAADKLRLVGVLDAQREGDEAVDHEAFRQQLDKLGWTAGKNINIEYRWGAGSIDRVQAFAKELARLNPDVLVGITTPATAALQAEAHTVPIVFAQVSDPVGSGFVNSLANPGANITGFINIEASLSSKWLELMRAVAPQVTRSVSCLIRRPRPMLGTISIRSDPLPRRSRLSRSKLLFTTRQNLKPY
jgi:putative tryptophan/tyrosine transport system substrate-binding protein